MNRKQFVFLSSSSLNIQQSKDVMEISLDSIVNLSIKKGWLFHSLVIEAEEQYFVLKGYRQSDLLNFNHGVVTALLELISNSDKWQAYQQSLDKLVAKNIYLSSYEWEPIAEIYKLVCKLQNLGISSEQLVSPLQKQVFEEAKLLPAETISELGRSLHNKQVTPLLVNKYKKFFDEVVKNPLTDKQRVACVVNDDHTVVVNKYWPRF
ncbi:hypothetical protein [Photobacterium leiognathi]|uniref:hypothetical protein n=1 Tax=Photobacterium leiognathi TaxID=553611 RepID=UPI00298182A7|nr:hypothetical protein [Photobacterium leiognathi]